MKFMRLEYIETDDGQMHSLGKGTEWWEVWTAEEIESHLYRIFGTKPALIDIEVHNENYPLCFEITKDDGKYRFLYGGVF